MGYERFEIDEDKSCGGQGTVRRTFKTTRVEGSWTTSEESTGWYECKGCVDCKPIRKEVAS